NTCAQAGNTPAMSGLTLTSIASPSEVPTMTELRLSVRSTFDRVWMPTSATEANRANDAPLSTGEGSRWATAPAYGRTPRTHMIATEANRASEAPPSTGEGIAATTAPAFGRTPRTIMITPAPATTQRDFTRVRRTRPMSWAKHV